MVPVVSRDSPKLYQTTIAIDHRQYCQSYHVSRIDNFILKKMHMCAFGGVRVPYAFALSLCVSIVIVPIY